ncbi:hypothetical protein [Prochlorococcus sp. MIT 1341]|uniref:hypothetical protein n=1 Tax=Prochlorococcus sp. MIT 1341 TaxID=3096221 RepID=UPI002A754CED|nr:hypothetical protein [Prochlorococcus sp. MIT 1341]
MFNYQLNVAEIKYLSASERLCRTALQYLLSLSVSDLKVALTGLISVEVIQTATIFIHRSSNS